MKKIIACILSMILIVGSLPVLSVGAETKSLVETYEFCEELSVLMVLEGHTYCLPKIIDKDADGYKDGKKSTYKYIYSFFTPKNVRKCTELKIFKESDSVVVFGITGRADSLETDIIGDYIFHAREGFYSRVFPDNNCGYFVYTTDNIYSLNGAVEKGIVDVNEMAKLIPYTEYVGENEPPTETEVVTPTEPTAETQPATEKIVKKKQPMTVGTFTKTVKASKLKKTKVTVKNAITVKKNQGAVSYSKSGGSKYLSISKNGVITVKKGKYKKDTVLSIKVKVTAAGNSNYKSGSKTVTVKIKVK